MSSGHASVPLVTHCTAGHDALSDVDDIVVLITSADPEKLRAGRPDLFARPGVRWLTLDPAELTSPLRLAARLRAVSTGYFVVAARTLDGDRNPVVLKLLAMLPSAGQRALIDESGLIIPCTRLGFVVHDSLLLAAQALLSVMLILVSLAWLMPARAILIRRRRPGGGG